MDLIIDQILAKLLNYNHFHGALRHLTINTLRLGQNLPTDAEISVHTTHPLEWEAQYRMGTQVRRNTAQNNTNINYNDTYQNQYYNHTNIWLMDKAYRSPNGPLMFSQMVTLLIN